VTITDADKEMFQATVSDFHPQYFEDQCYPAALKNVIDELADRKGKEEMKCSLSDVNTICGYKQGLRCEEEFIQSRLTDEMTQHGYEAVEEQAPEMDLSALDTIISDNNTSLPIVELDGNYFNHVRNYDCQPSEDGTGPHVVVPFKVTSDEILYYDPFEKYFEKKSAYDAVPERLDMTDFFELWSGESEERWTLWLARRGHELTDQFTDPE
jgi:hypothetical protein